MALSFTLNEVRVQLNMGQSRYENLCTRIRITKHAEHHSPTHAIMAN